MQGKNTGGGAKPWETPKTGLFGKGPYSLASVKKEFNLKLDPCAPLEAKQFPERACCDKFYTIEEDGLKQDWKDGAFVNPMYDRKTITAFLNKGLKESMKWGIPVVNFLPVWSDTDWWHDLILPYAEIRYIRGRPRFWLNGKLDKTAPKDPICLAIYQFPKMEDYPWSHL